MELRFQHALWCGDRRFVFDLRSVGIGHGYSAAQPIDADIDPVRAIVDRDAAASGAAVRVEADCAGRLVAPFAGNRQQYDVELYR